MRSLLISCNYNRYINSNIFVEKDESVNKDAYFDTMRIALLESFYTGSHKSWIKGLIKNSNHEIIPITMEGKFWKWRMRGGAITLAKKFIEMKIKPDIFLISDMVDITTFKSLIKKEFSNIPIFIYFHENQLSYPWNEENNNATQKEKNYFGFINYISALTSDHNFFNSEYHKNIFLKDIRKLLDQFPDHKELDTIEKIKKKSTVLPLGIDLKRLDQFEIDQTNKHPLVLWNHRWEYDKNPKTFFDALYKIDKEGIDFELAVIGESYNNNPAIFNEAKNKLSHRIIKFGFCDTLDEYAKYLWIADLIPITNIQDFFGISLVEAVYCNTYPLLPNRLSYPELIDYNVFHSLYYENEDSFFSLLKNSIKDIKKIRENSLRDQIIKFDWSNMAKDYDKILLDLFTNNKQN